MASTSMKTTVIITGASRGFGRCLALDFCRQVPAGDLDLHLWARDASGLAATEQLAQAAWTDAIASAQSPRQLRTFTETVDLGQHADYVPKIEALLSALTTEAPTRIYLVHNAGTLGDLGYPHEWPSPAHLGQFWELNVTSVLWFNKRFVEVFGPTPAELAASSSEQPQEQPSASETPLTPARQATIVNITSLCAIEPFETHGLYCTSKAAREMHHRVLAKELEGSGSAAKIRVLNYSPGPMDTAMQRTLRESPVLHARYRELFATMKNEGTLIDPAVSSALGVALALGDTFESGAHVDYYDLAPPERQVA